MNVPNVSVFSSQINRFNLEESSESLGKIQERVNSYYQSATEALLHSNIQKLSASIREIREIDPEMKYLDLNQKMHLFAQERILKLSESLDEANRKIASLESKLKSQEKKLDRVEEEATGIPRDHMKPDRWGASLYWTKNKFMPRNSLILKM